MSATAQALKLHLIAAEESGDVLGGALMGALRAQHGTISFAGLGGRAMAAQGITSPFDTADLSIIPQDCPTNVGGSRVE